jgi:hypothetical protein
MVAYVCNPSLLKVEIGRMVHQGQPGEKVPRSPISTDKLGGVVFTYNSSFMAGLR